MHTASPSLFQLAHGMAALPLLLADPGVPSSTNTPGVRDFLLQTFEDSLVQTILFDYFKYRYFKEMIF